MIGRRPQPLIGKLAGVLFSGGKSDPPKTMKRYDLGGGVGLGIVAALEKSDFVSHHKSNKPFCITRYQSRPVPIPVEMENSEEDYTFVTCHGPNKNKTSTRVYYDAGLNTTREKSVQPLDTSSDDFSESGFLSYCDLCHKNLHGKDIYMYRGEKAFCSTECRYVEIVKDERKEKQRLCSSRSASTSATSPYNVVTTNGLNFATGIFAT